MPRNGAKDSPIFNESLLPACIFVRTANILVGRYEESIPPIRGSPRARLVNDSDTTKDGSTLDFSTVQTIFIVPASIFSSGLGFQPTLRAVP
jgi:hypothetical protein